MTNGVISGTPTVNQTTAVTYTLYANNSGGSDNETFTITINEPVANLGSIADQTFVRNSTITDIVATNTGGEVATWAIHPTLPAGLSMTNGVISGTPSVNQTTAVTYTLYANNSGGTDSVSFTITINEPVAILGPVADQTFTRTVAITDIVVANTGGSVATWEIVPSLPSGLSMNNGVISGTPTVNQTTAVTYTLYANNSGGSDSVSFTITINEPLPVLSATSHDVILTRGVAMTNVVISSSTSNVQTWEIVPTLPSGLVFNNGLISGTPTVNSTLVAYTIYGNNSGGSANTTVNITINEPVAILSTISDQVMTRGVTITDLVTSNTGGVVASWEISPALPTGLSMTGGVISGTPSINQTTAVMYTLFANNSGGSTNISFNITINEPVANIAPISDQTYTRGVTITNVVATNTGGSVASWEISPSLPAGLSMTNGVISGTPSVNQTTAVTYTLYANNSGGSDSETFTITINEPLPILSPISDQIFTRGTTITDIVVNNTGGAVATWEINPALPAGLTMTNGVISGTPTVNQTTAVTYTLYANNSGGSANVSFNITINEPVAILTPISDKVFTRGVTISNFNSTSSGGVVATWEIDPSLPSGLSMVNGVISGTPTVNQTTAVLYTLYANNSGGSVNVTFNITINEPVAILSSISDQVFTRGIAITDFNTVNTGGAVQTWEISPALPNGITMAGGIFSGTPSVNQTTAVMYTLFANNSGGSANVSFNITINEPVPILGAIGDQVFTRNVTISDISAVNSGGNVATWEISPALPAGLTMVNGLISGTPTVNQTTAVSYTLFANNSGGTSSVMFNITILEPVAILQPLNDLVFTRNLTISDVIINNTGGSVANWAITPAIPAGLSFSNGVISGTPSVNLTTTLFTVWANNSGGSTNITFNITINEPLPILTPSTTAVVLTRGEVMDQVYVNSTGGVVSTWEIYPSLPSGLALNNGIISGTPSVNSTEVNYTVFANNSGGSTNVTISITINEPVAILSAISDQTYTRNQSISSIQTTNSGGFVATWEISPALPNGLTFNGGVITGTPSVNLTTTSFTIWANNSGGTASITFNITVNEPVAILSSITDKVFTRGVNITNFSTNNTGGNVATWEITPALPTGLVMTGGVISGAPSVNLSTTLFTIYANNSGGSANISFNITINEPVPYLPPMSDRTFTRGVAVAPIQVFNAPIVFSNPNGGVVETWAIHPALPLGLNFSNGFLSGTPQVNLTTTPYTIYANNSGGSASRPFNITINEPPASLSNVSDQIYTRLQTITDLAINNSGGAISSWEIDPALPSGLTFAGGVISGTPTQNMTETLYTVYANNSGGSTNVSFNITVLEPVPVIAPIPDQVFTRDVTISDIIANNTGGMVANWTITPALPSGLSMLNGVISGTPSVNSTTVLYTLYANNSGGTSSTSFNITILEPIANITYSPTNYNFTRGIAINPIVPTNTGGNPETWSVHPSLPSGLVFDNGSISGTPIVNSTETNYTIWANNTGGNFQSWIVIIVVEPVPNISYSPVDLVLTRNETMTSLVVNNTGGVVSEWGIHPQLPSGLLFTNGVISGTPTQNQTIQNYTIFANNSGGQDTFNITITVNEPIANISYNPDTFVFRRTETITPVNVNQSGGVVATWAIEPSLPAGLNFSQGRITGTPTVIMNSTNFTIWANNSGGNASVVINITVVDIPPSINSSAASVVLVRSINMTNITFNNSGGEIITWEVHPTLPPGISINTENGTISGNPEINMTTALYTVYANNSGGSSSVQIFITILEPAPELIHAQAVYELTRGVNATPITVNNTGGNPESWSIFPDLPEGLVFNEFDGTITGTPVNNMTATSYQIRAENLGGSSTSTIIITVVEPEPILNISDNNITIYVGDSLENISITNSGGPIANWTITPALPEGISFSEYHQVIFGSPVTVSSGIYTISAINSGGVSSVEFNLTVLTTPPELSTISSLSEFLLIRGEEIETISINNSGGDVVNWSVIGDLPRGLTFNDDNQTITGTPLDNSDWVNVSLYAENSAGNSTLTLSFKIVEEAPSISTFSDNYTLTRGDITNPISVINSGGQVFNWTILPELPNGLFFDADNFTIIGTPLVNLTTTQFSINASNDGGWSQIFINITILEPIPELYAIEVEFVFTRGQDIGNISIFNNGGNVEEWDNTILPEGLELSQDGILSGTPSANSTQSNYLVYANNSGGTGSLQITITIIEPVPEFTYEEEVIIPSDSENVRIQLISDDGGAIEYFTIEPELPAGLVFNTTTGIISGIPEQEFDETTFTITAHNTGGNYSQDITLSYEKESVWETSNLPLWEMCCGLLLILLLIILAWLRIVVIPAIFGKKGVRYEPKKAVYRVGSTIITKVEAEEVYDEEFELPDYKTAMEPVTENLVCRDWSIEPKLPKGMEIDSLTGAIKGRPKEMSEKTKYIVTTKVHNGVKKLRVSITVIEALEKDDIDEELVEEQETEEISSPDSSLEEVEESILEEEFEEVTDSSDSNQEISDSEDLIEEEESFDDEIEEDDFEDEEEFEEEEDLEDDQEEYFEDDESHYGKEKTKRKREDTWRREFINIGYTPPAREVEEEKPKVHSRYARKDVSDEVDEEDTEYFDDDEYIEDSEDIIDDDFIERDDDENWDDDVEEEEYLEQDSDSEFTDEDEDWDDDSEIVDDTEELTVEQDTQRKPATDRAQVKSEASETRREAFKAVKSAETDDVEPSQEEAPGKKKPTKVRGIRTENESADESSRSTRSERETDTSSTTTSTKRSPSKVRGVREEDTASSTTTSTTKRRPTKVRGVREEDTASSTTTSSTKRRPSKVRGIKDDSASTRRPSRERGVRDSETKPSAPRRRKERERGIKVDENSILNIGYKPKRRGEKKVLKRGERDRGIKIDSSSRLAIPKKSEEKKEDVPKEKAAGSERDRGIKLEKKSGMSVDYTKPEKKKKAPVKKGERDRGIKPGEKERELPKKRERKGKF